MRRYIDLARKTVLGRLLKDPFRVDFVGLSCAPRDFSAIIGTKPNSLGIPTEEGPSYCERKELFNYVEALWHAVVSNIHLL